LSDRVLIAENRCTALFVSTATAARQILTRIHPGQKAKIEEAYAASLNAIPDGPAKTEGIKLVV
jgi:hypothetical protein